MSILPIEALGHMIVCGLRWASWFVYLLAILCRSAIRPSIFLSPCRLCLGKGCALFWGGGGDITETHRTQFAQFSMQSRAWTLFDQ
jgi:hypothetical protein